VLKLQVVYLAVGMQMQPSTYGSTVR